MSKGIVENVLRCLLGPQLFNKEMQPDFLQPIIPTLIEDCSHMLGSRCDPPPPNNSSP